MVETLCDQTEPWSFLSPPHIVGHLTPSGLGKQEGVKDATLTPVTAGWEGMTLSHQDPGTEHGHTHPRWAQVPNLGQERAGRGLEIAAQRRGDILMLAGATVCLSLPPEIKEGSPLPGGLCDFRILGAAAETEPEVSGVGLEGQIQPLVVDAGCCERRGGVHDPRMSEGSGHLWAGEG